MKGISEIQHTYSSERLQVPMKRVGERGSGEFVEITWDEALDTVSDNIKKINEKYGKQAICYMPSVDTLSVNLGSILGAQEKPHRGIDIGLGNGFSPAIAESGGQGAASNEIKDWKNAKTILNIGCNVLETCMVTARYFFEAKEAGAEIITIDPNFCTTAAKSSRWIPIEPGTDAALYLGMMSIILESNWHDADYLRANTSMPFLVKESDGSMLRDHRALSPKESGAENAFFVWDTVSSSVKSYNTEGIKPDLEAVVEVDGERYVTVFELFRKNQEPYTSAWAAKKTGIPENVLQEITKKYACEGPSILSFGFGGADKFSNADVSGHAAVVLATLIGTFGSENGAGAGAYVNAYQKIFGAAKIPKWPLPDECKAASAPKESIDARDDKSGIRMLYFQDGAIQQCSANMGKTVDWVKSLDFVVAQEIWHTPSVDYADIVLPVCSHFELDEEIGGLRALRGHALLQQKVLDPLFESKTDFWIETQLAKRLGYGDVMPASQEELVRFQLEKTKDSALKGITLEELIEHKGVVALKNQPDIGRNYIGQKYLTASGKIDLYYENLVSFKQALPTYEEPCEVYAENPLREKYPLQFFQRRTKYHIHCNMVDSTWIKQFYTPSVEMHPLDARKRGLASGDMLEVFNDRGSFSCACAITEAIRPGTIAIVEGVWDKYMNFGSLQNVTNDTAIARGKALPKGRVIPFNDTLVEVKKV
ncbi:MAG: molybdopterin-dependent oxidoreductase [Raoultibacter sp.]